MSALISIATGNFTAAGTWGLVDPTAYLDSEAASTQLTTSFVESSAFTPGAITIDGIAVKVASRVASPSGTLDLRIAQGGSLVAGTNVSINVSDLENQQSINQGWVFLKFASPVTLLGATAYTLSAKTSASTQVTLYRDGTAGNWSRLLRTTTTQAPAANDQIHVIGEWTGAGAQTTFTMTNDNTATTSFGPTVSGGPPQGVTVGKGGTWTNGTSASTAYYFKWKGVFAVFSGGTVNVGTSGTRIPSTSSATYFMDSAANVDSGFVTFPGATFNGYGNTITTTQTLLTAGIGGFCNTSGTAVTAIGLAQSFVGLTGTIRINGVNYTISSVTDATHLTLTGSAGTQTKVEWTHAGTAATLTVGSTSGWAANDQIAVASTTRTRSQCELASILSVDSATQVTLSAGLTYTHHGADPMQAEVVHLTRNVKFVGASDSLQGYVVWGTTAAVVCSYVEFYRLGSGTTGKRGIDCQTTTGSCSMTYCSMHEFLVSSSYGFNYSATSGNGFTFSNNVAWKIASYSLVVATTSAAWTLSTNTLLYSVDGTGVGISDVGGTLDALTIVGGSLGVLEGAIIGSWSNITVHSGGAIGFLYCTGYIGGVVKHWRYGGENAFDLSRGADIVIADLRIWGHVYTAITLGYNAGNRLVALATLVTGDLCFSCATGFQPTDNGAWGLSLAEFHNGSFSSAVSPYAALTGTDLFISTAAGGRVLLDNISLGAPTPVNISTLAHQATIVAAQRLNGTAGNHKTWKKNGTFQTDSTLYRTASPSMRLTPNTASYKLTSEGYYGGFKVNVASGQTCTPTVYVRESESGDGATYNGARARLILKQNNAMGITADTVIDTATSASDGAWEALTGTTAAVTDDGVLEFIIDCDGTAGWINVDDFSATVA